MTQFIGSHELSMKAIDFLLRENQNFVENDMQEFADGLDEHERDYFYKQYNVYQTKLDCFCCYNWQTPDEWEKWAEAYKTTGEESKVRDDLSRRLSNLATKKESHADIEVLLAKYPSNAPF
jgi:hypothetical protein